MAYIKKIKLPSGESRDIMGSTYIDTADNWSSSSLTLKKGEIAPLITSGAGYHVMMAEEVTEGESETWKRAKDQCRDQIAMRESQRLIESWLSDLMGKNYVSILVNRDVSGEVE